MAVIAFFGHLGAVKQDVGDHVTISNSFHIITHKHINNTIYNQNICAIQNDYTVYVLQLQL